MTDFYKAKVTIYNDIPATEAGPRSFERFVIDKCNIQGGYVRKADGTIEDIVNSKSVITKAIAHYKSPAEFMTLPVEDRSRFYTARVGDFIVFDEVDDAVTNAQEFAALQKKYADVGMRVASVSANIHGMAVDNITMTNA